MIDEAFEITDNTLIVFRVDSHIDGIDIAIRAKALLDHYIQQGINPTVIAIEKKVQITTLSEIEMEKHGWIRKKDNA